MPTQTAAAKESFESIYVHKNPTQFKTQIMDRLSYVCDNYTRQEFDRLVLPEMQRIAATKGSVKCVDLLACFGNTTLACVNGMSSDQIKDNWKDDASCEKISAQRRFNCTVTGIDISKEALDYGTRSGIFNDSCCGDINSKAGLDACTPIMKGAELLIATAALVYLSTDAVEHIVKEFAGGDGEGYAIVNFLNPFEPEKTDAMKRILCKHLEMVGTRASRHRKMSDKELKNYPEYGDWALLEIWVMRRKNRMKIGQEVKPTLPKIGSGSAIDATCMSPKAAWEAPDTPSKSPAYKPLVTKGAIKQALITAASRLSSLDSQAGPKCLIQLGDAPIICHVLSQMRHSGMERVVILCGYQGEKIKQAVEKKLPAEDAKKLKIEYIMLGDAWQKGHAQSITEAKNSFKKGEPFLLCMSDHIFDPELIAKMSAARFSKPDASEAFCLVETDTEGLHGLPSTAVKVLFNKVDLEDMTVKSISRTLELSKADGVEAGLFSVNSSIFEKLEFLASERAYFSLAEVMALYAGDNALRPVETKQQMWFSVETKETLAYAVSDGMKNIGVVPEDSEWLGMGAFGPDGQPIKVYPVGVGKKQNTPTGGSWEEFTVERWRSAVYINMLYFSDLCDHVIKFVIEIGKHMKLRGQRVSLCEVGCGTGEFIRPLADHFRCAIGVDFNKNFIEFCNSHIPAGKEAKMKYVYGDATRLVDLMKEKGPAHFQDDTKIVCCVGNTMGIIPDFLKRQIYLQMAALAGKEGVVVICYWNARSFGDACQNFYHANPQLCGHFTGESINFSNTTLTTEVYKSHWTGVEEARQILEELGLEEIVVEECGKGVLVAARVSATTPLV